MRKPPTWIPYIQTTSPARSSSIRPVQQHAITIEQFRCHRYSKPAAEYPRRPLSTRSDDTNLFQDGATRLATEKDGLKQPSNGTPGPQLDSVIKEDSKPSFTITPRFQWRWRWHYSDSPRNKKTNIRKGKDKPEGWTPPEPSKSGHFLPTRSEEAQGQLQSVLEGLKSMSGELQPPLSPLEKVLGEQEWTTKRQPTKEEKKKLAYNPWAMMLAGQLRFDSASRTRLPETLLVPMGIVTKPGTESVYLLPDDLANFEAYDKELSKGLRRAAMMDLRRENGGTTIKVLPYKTLINELTDEMVVWDSRLNTGRTKNAVVAKRLLPTKWMERMQTVRSYQNASKEYWNVKEKLGEMDEQNFKKPEPPFDIFQVQWQPNVAERMQSIMRQRLLLAIDQLGRKVNEPRSRPRRHTMCFNWPDSLFLDVLAESTRIPTDELSAGKRGVNYSLGAQLYRLADQDTVSAGPSVTGSSWEPVQSAQHFLDPDIWLPGSCLLHIGPPEMALTALSPFQQPPRDLDGQFISSSESNKFTTPMLKVNNSLRLPVFNIPALLGPKFDHPLQQILARHNMSSPSLNAPAIDDSNNTTTSLSQNYLILIRATAPGYHYVARELWQLWRYLGGLDCLRPNPAPTPQQLRARAPMQKKRDKIKEYSMSKRVWDHLYTFLPGIERVPLPEVKSGPIHESGDGDDEGAVESQNEETTVETKKKEVIDDSG